MGGRGRARDEFKLAVWPRRWVLKLKPEAASCHSDQCLHVQLSIIQLNPSTRYQLLQAEVAPRPPLINPLKLNRYNCTYV